MPTTRAQALGRKHEPPPLKSRKKRTKPSSKGKTEAGGDTEADDHAAKRPKAEKSDVEKQEEFTKVHGTLERGHIYFFYRPKVGVEESHDIDDVAKFQLLLVPSQDAGKSSSDETTAPSGEQEDKPKIRVRQIAIGKKRLPDPEAKHEVFWASVVNASDNLENLEQGLKEKVYQTKTKGERYIQPARIAGRGVYVIFSPTDTSLPPSKRDQTYLVYHLSHPLPPGEVQTELEIYASSSFVLQVKNPETGGPPQVGLPPEKRADYPEEAKESAFGEGVGARRFVPANPPALLDYEGAELLLIGDKTNIEGVIGEDRAKDLKSVAEADTEKLSAEEVIGELSLDPEKFPRDAIEGKWK